MKLIDFVKELPDNYELELSYYWEEEVDEAEDENGRSIGLDVEVCVLSTIKEALETRFGGYQDYWEDIEVFKSQRIYNFGVVTKLLVDHENEKVEMSYINFSYDE